MTLRLVALMSIVLLLSLSAFAVLVQSYQDDILEEVARTASEVGQATLGSLDGSSLRFGPVDEEIIAIAPDGRTVGHDIRRIRSYSSIRSKARQEPGAEGHDVVVQVEVATSDGEKVDWIGHGDDVEKLVQRCAGVHAEDPELCAKLEEIGERMLQMPPLDSEGTESRNTFVFVTDTVHVDREVRDGMMTLRIPTFAADQGDDSSLAMRDPIELPIPLEEYDEVFDKIRKRSLLLVLGIFLVGTVLTAGVASRFTRPIRKLDAGIHRIGEGDLDVTVPVEGKDEIARLGTAFNEMSGRLRANRDREREMVRREKLSALGGLAAGVAHDVRNPLHSINLTLQHLAEVCRPDDAAKGEDFDESIAILRGEVRRLDDLVGNFLRFARTEQSVRQPVDLADLLGETERLIRKESEWRKIEVSLDLNAAVPAISADAESLRSAVLNLVLNGFEAMPDGGSLRLATGVEGEHAWIEVTDDGSGIPSEQQEKVFEFAYTTRDSGSGLGLAMVHHCVVEEHGGRVILDSEEGRGTRVRLLLPLTPPVREEERA